MVGQGNQASREALVLGLLREQVSQIFGRICPQADRSDLGILGRKSWSGVFGFVQRRILREQDRGAGPDRFFAVAYGD